MNNIKRFECGMTNAPVEYQTPTMHQSNDGEYVSYEDYIALQQKLVTLAEQHDAVVAEMSIVKNDYATIPEVKCIGWPNTPNFDAAIAALRAEAIRFAACHLPDNGKYQDIIYVLANEIEEGLTEFKFPVARQFRDSKGEVQS